jgi:CubicO group peptidase (beta-lactamase class C family)
MPFDLARAQAHADAIAATWEAERGPGGAIVLFDRDGPRAAACGGRASLDHALAITPDTAFRWASITKHVLAALVLREGGIGLDDPLGQYLPELAPAPAAVPVGRALDMTSGIADAMEALWQLGVPWTATHTRDALFRFTAGIDALNHPPGTEISYTNTGYRWMQHAIEKRVGPVGAAWREAFFAPLGLASVHFPEDWTDPVPNLATGYWRDETGGWHSGRYGTHLSASGGLAGSARDLATWLAALLADRAAVQGLLPRLAQRRRLTDGRETGYGLGIAHAPFLGIPLYGHGGSLPGFKNHVLIAPEHGVGVVLLSNREDTDPLGIALEVIAAGLDATLPPAATALPDGLFAAEDGTPFWIELAGGRVAFLGASERLFEGGDGWAVSRSPYMWIRLRYEGGAIAGEINHVARRFVPVSRDAALDPAWAGRWRNDALGAEFEVAVAQGAATLTMGVGPLRNAMPLVPLGADRALGRRSDGPWMQRPCFAFAGDTCRLVTNRCRVFTFRRA